MGRPVEKLEKKLDRALGELLLKIIRKGRDAYDGNGCPVVDEYGAPVRRPASAADIKAAVDYLNAVGYWGNRQPAGSGGRIEEVLTGLRKRSMPKEQEEQAEAERERQRQQLSRVQKNIAIADRARVDETNAPIPFNAGAKGA